MARGDIEISIGADATGAIKGFADIEDAALDAVADMRKVAQVADGALGWLSELADSIGGEFGRVGAGLTGVGDRIAELDPSLAGLGGALSEAGKNLTLVSDGLDVVTGLANSAKGVMAALTKGQLLSNAATKAAAAVQWAMNAALAANPVGVVVVALAALTAGLIWAYHNVKPLRDACDRAFSAIADAARWMWNEVLQPVVKGMVDGFADIVDGIGWMLDGLGNIPGFEWAKDAADAMKGTADEARKLADSIGKIPGSKTISVSIKTLQKQIDIAPAPGKAGKLGWKISTFATGGLALGPQLALIGDNPGRKEAVIPSELWDRMGGTTNIYNIAVQGDTDPQAAGRRIIAELNRIARARGRSFDV